MLNGDSGVSGTVYFEQASASAPVVVSGAVKGLDANAKRGFHIQYVFLPSISLHILLTQRSSFTSTNPCRESILMTHVFTLQRPRRRDERLHLCRRALQPFREDARRADRLGAACRRLGQHSIKLVWYCGLGHRRRAADAERPAEYRRAECRCAYSGCWSFELHILFLN